jgi:glycosyltransferase involved in cell wall biosynthesis
MGQRVLVVSSYPPRHCGIGAYARDQVSRLRSEGHEVTVLSPPDGDGDERVGFFDGRPFRQAEQMCGGFDRVVVHFQPALYFRTRRPLSKVRTSAALAKLAAACPALDLLVHEADRPIWWRPDYLLLRRAFARSARVSFHTDAERQALERLYRVQVRGQVVPHRVAAVQPLPREEARARLSISGGEPVFLCPGFLQPSKGFDRAVSAFAAAFPGGEGAALYIVGSVRDANAENRAYAGDLRERAAATTGVRLLDRFLSDEDFDVWVAAADRVILPYRRSWSSGVLARAHELGTPAIVAAVGGLPEQAGPMDVLFEDERGLREALIQAAAPGRQGGPEEAESRPPREAAG